MRNKITKKKPRRDLNRDLQLTRLPRVTTIRAPGQIMPPQVMATVCFQENVALYSATAPYFAYPLHTNAPYDVDPAFGSTSTQGLTELANFYGTMRVLSYKTKITFHNTATQSADVFIQHVNSTPVVAGGGNYDLLPNSMNQFTSSHLLGSVSAQSLLVVEGNHTIAEIAGTEAVRTDTEYQSATNTTPVNKTFLVIGARTLNVAGVFSNPVNTLVQVYMTCLFSERKILSA